MALFPHRKSLFRAFSAAAALSAFALTATAADPETNPLSPDSITFRTRYRLIEFTALADNAIRVRYTQNKAFSKKPEFILTNTKPVPFKKVEKKEDGSVFCYTDSMRVNFIAGSDTIEFCKGFGAEDKVEWYRFLEEGSFEAPRHFEKSPSRDAPADSYCVQTTFQQFDATAFYGLGQFQDGALDIAGLPRQLLQVNTQASVPFMISPESGYGILWHNYSRTLFNPADTPIELKKVGEGQGQTVNVTTTTGGRREFRRDNTLSGEFTVEKDGIYAFQLDSGQTMARRHVLAIDGKTIVDQRNMWLPPVVGFKAELTAG